jgi:hypothetical protein
LVLYNIDGLWIKYEPGTQVETKIKVKIVPWHALKSDMWEYVGMTPLILKLSRKWRWVVTLIPQLLYAWCVLSTRLGGHQNQLDILQESKISPAGNHTVPESFSLWCSRCARCAVLAWQKLKWLVRNVWQCHFVLHSLHMDCAGITGGVVQCMARHGIAC